jgi:hypothetical protein
MREAGALDEAVPAQSTAVKSVQRGQTVGATHHEFGSLRQRDSETLATHCSVRL